MWEAIVLIDFTLITKTPAPRQKPFHGSVPWGCGSLIPGKEKIGGISLKCSVEVGRTVRWSGRVGRAEFRFLFFLLHRETSGKSLTLEKKTFP